MVSKLGKFFRNLRFDTGELLYDMANNLGVSSSFLSRVETGQKKPPIEWHDKIISLYDLHGEQLKEFEELFFDTVNNDSINISALTMSDKALMLEFARKFEGMNKDRLRRFLDGEDN